MPDSKDRAMSTPHPSPRPRTTVTPAAPPELRLIPGQRPAGPEQLSLELEWEVAPGVPAVPRVPRALHLVTDAGRPAVDTSGLPDPRAWVAQIACAVAEVSIGARPAGQLTRWVARDELARLARRGTFAARHPSMAGRRSTPSTRIVRAVRLCPIAPGIIEASAVLVGSDRAQAIALRIEAVGGRWLATAVELG
jgi:hypothetical protein